MSDRISQRVASVPPSGIRRFFDIAATMPDVISLGIGEPDFVTPDAIRNAGVASLQRGETRYTSNSGTIELRRAVAAKLAALYGVSYDPETELLITVGVSEALYLAMTAILDPGDEVIVPQPCFVAYTAEVTFAGGVPVPIPTYVETQFQVTAQQIDDGVVPRRLGGGTASELRGGVEGHRRPPRWRTRGRGTRHRARRRAPGRGWR